MPFTAKSSGRLSKEAARFLSDLSEIAAFDVYASKSAFVKTAQQELRRLCHGNARKYFWSLLVRTQGVGRGFMPELERAVDVAGDI